MTDMQSMMTESLALGAKVFGNINYSNVRLGLSKKIQIKKQMLAWIARHGQLITPEAEVQYWVRFHRNPRGHEVTCRVEVLGPTQIWEGLESSRQSFEAFTECLSRLVPSSALALEVA